MTHSYKAQFSPDISVPAEIGHFVEEFYRVTDDPDKIDQYVEQYTTDATFILASRKARGFEEIRATRVGMWSLIASRRHSILRVFPFSTGSNEFMLQGSVALGLRNGANVDVPWAARLDLVKCDDGKWRVKYYQVYLDTAAITAHAK